MNRDPFEIGEFYHIYNHGVEDRNIFGDEKDAERFVKCLEVFNTIDPIGGLYAESLLDKQIPRGPTSSEKLVNLVSYCLNPNHYHLLLEEVFVGGISEFMKRIGVGYTLYFNVKNKRKGTLFRGKFRSTWVSTDEYLLYLSAYINLNFKVHKLPEEVLKVVRSSWSEYIEKTKREICNKDVTLKQFKNKEEYRKYAEDSLILMIEKKESDRQLRYLAID
jgi:putative transposase